MPGNFNTEPSKSLDQILANLHDWSEGDADIPKSLSVAMEECLFSARGMYANLTGHFKNMRGDHIIADRLSELSIRDILVFLKYTELDKFLQIEKKKRIFTFKKITIQEKENIISFFNQSTALDVFSLSVYRKRKN